MPQRLTVLLGFALVAACSTDTVDTKITRHPVFAHVRAFYVSSAASQHDSYVAVSDELAVALNPTSPGTAEAVAFQHQVIGDWTVYVSENGRTAASSKK